MVPDTGNIKPMNIGATDQSTGDDIDQEESQNRPVMSKYPRLNVQMIVDTILFLAMLGPLTALNMLGQPIKNGFWCNDQSISLPYKPDSVSKHVLLLLSIGGPLIVICLTESIRTAYRSKTERHLKTRLPLSVAKAYGVFLFGLAADCFFTEMLKYSVGRLRPHFLDVCKPNFDKVNCSSVAWPMTRFWLTNSVDPCGNMNLEDIKFVLNPPKACAHVRDFDALMVVHSATHHFKQRQIYRDTYGNHIFTHPYRIKVVFFLGLLRKSKAYLKGRVAEEHKVKRDIVQANFVDTYLNTTCKATSALRWIIENCGMGSKLIIKIDDDVLLDVHRMFKEYVSLPPYQNNYLVHCHTWEGAKVVRQGKWRVHPRRYGIDTFPEYCSGFFVMLKRPAVEELYHTAIKTPIVWIDDVFIYGIVRQKTPNVQLVYLDHVTESEEEYNNCVQLYGYRCKFWATTLNKNPRKRLLPRLVHLQVERQRWLKAQLPGGTHQAAAAGDQKTNSSENTQPAIDLRRNKRHRRRFDRMRHRFVEGYEYECMNDDVDPKVLRDSRLSFPSGHASVSVYSALFSVFYLQLRMSPGFSHLLRPMLQLGLVLMATFCCVSRLTDHKHFVSDIAAGATLGSALAWLTFYKLGIRVIPDSPPPTKPRVLPRALSVESEPQTPTPLLRPAAYVQVRRHDFADKV